MAVRMANLINRVGLERELVVTGGQSKNIGIVSRIETSFRREVFADAELAETAA